MTTSPLLSTRYLSEYNVEYSVYSCPKVLAFEIDRVFKNSLIENNHNLTLQDIVQTVKIIPTWQRSRMSLLESSTEVRKEQDRLFINFRRFYDTLVDLANEDGSWVNASSPYSGEPLDGIPTAFTHNELETLTHLQNFPHQSVGCCGLVLHPTFQENGYPITIFTSLDLNSLKF